MVGTAITRPVQWLVQQAALFTFSSSNEMDKRAN